MSYSHRVQRRQRRRRSRRITITAAVLGTLAVVAILALLRSGGNEDQSTEAGASKAPAARAGSLQRVDRPAATGAPLTVKTAEGFVYRLQAVGGGTSPDVKQGAVTTAPDQTYAYVDYVLTNAGRVPALLEYPADIFVRRAVAPGQATCVSILGSAKDTCTLASTSRLVGRLGDSPDPSPDSAGDSYLPPGGSYLVRAVVDAPVPTDVGQEDLSLYVWSVRYNGARIAKPVLFPG